jgi:two-component system response regulator FixJ
MGGDVGTAGLLQIDCGDSVRFRTDITAPFAKNEYGIIETRGLESNARENAMSGSFHRDNGYESDRHATLSLRGAVSHDGSATDTARLQQATVFIVDSDVEAANSTAARLTNAGLMARAYSNATTFLGACNRTDEGCVLLELRLGKTNGLDMMAELAARGIAMPVVILSESVDVPTTVKAMKAGALNVLEKPIDPVVLIDEVQVALRLDAERRKAAFGVELLSAREQQVMQMLLDARSTKYIARALDISPKTVEKHRANILLKLQVDSVSAMLIKMMPFRVRL